MGAHKRLRTPVMTMIALGAVMALALQPASAATTTRTGTMGMTVKSEVSGSCQLVPECLAFFGADAVHDVVNAVPALNPRCHPTLGPAMDPRPGNDAAEGTPASGSWADGAQVSILNVGGLPSTSLAFTTASSKLVQRWANAAQPSLSFDFFDSQCRPLPKYEGQAQAVFTWNVSFNLKVPRGTKWIAGWVGGNLAADITWTLGFPCGVPSHPAC